jgi:PAS domain S-box-containing protein
VSEVVASESLRILLIDDSPDERARVERELKRQFPGCRVEHVGSEADYADALRRGDFQLVISDYTLRWSDGLRILRGIKQHFPECPVILHTGTGNEEIAVAAMKAGLDDYIVKSPRHPSRVPTAVRLALARRREERALREMEARYRRLFDAVPIGLYRTHPDGRIFDVNQAMVEMLGYPGREAMKAVRTSATYADPEDRRRFVRDLMRDGVVTAREVRLVRRDGAEIWARLSARAIRNDDGHLLYFEGTAEDITDRRRVEETLRQAEKLAAMGELIAGVVHELNNPLSVVIGHVQLLRRAAEGGPLAARATKIGDAAERCARIVKNFLALARQHPPQRQPAHINQIVREALDLLAYQLRVDGVEVLLDLAPDLPVIHADPHQLQQVLLNLASNAHQAMREVQDARRLTVTTRAEASGSGVVVEVADTGPGIPPAVRERVFEPFFTTKPPGQGTGLGLSLCHGIVAAHGGTIRLADRPGAGASFVVTLPATAGASRPAAPEPGDAPRPDAALRVLVVDDEPDVAAVLADFLRADGHDVAVATDSRVALTALAAGRWDVVLSDLRMPHLSGPQLYHQVESRRPDLARRFAFLTGDLLDRETREFLERIDAPCLSKPFGPDEVRQVVAQAARGRRQ